MRRDRRHGQGMRQQWQYPGRAALGRWRSASTASSSSVRVGSDTVPSLTEIDVAISGEGRSVDTSTISDVVQPSEARVVARTNHRQRAPVLETPRSFLWCPFGHRRFLVGEGGIGGHRRFSGV